MAGPDSAARTSGADRDGAGVTAGDHVGEVARTALVAAGLCLAVSGWWVPGAVPALRSEVPRWAWLLVTGSVGLPLAAVGLTVPGEAPWTPVPDPGLAGPDRRRVVAGALVTVVAPPALYYVAVDLFSPSHHAARWSTAGTLLFGLGAVAVGWGLVATGLRGALARPRRGRPVGSPATAPVRAVTRLAWSLGSRSGNGATLLATAGAASFVVGGVALFAPWPTPLQPAVGAAVVVHPLVFVVGGWVLLVAGIDRWAGTGVVGVTAGRPATVRHLALAGGSLAGLSAALATTLTYFAYDSAPLLVYRVVLWILTPQAFLGTWVTVVAASLLAGELVSRAWSELRVRGRGTT